MYKLNKIICFEIDDLRFKIFRIFFEIVVRFVFDLKGVRKLIEKIEFFIL